MNVKTVLVILADGFEEVEALGTVDVLRRLHKRVLVVGLENKAVTSTRHVTVQADQLFSDTAFSTASAIVLPGGMPGTANLLANEELKEQLRNFNTSGKIIAAICAAPSVLKAAGVADGKTITGYPGCEQLSGCGDCTFSGNMLEHDGNLITAKGPGATFIFAGEIAKALGATDQEVQEVLSSMFIPGI